MKTLPCPEGGALAWPTKPWEKTGTGRQPKIIQNEATSIISICFMIFIILLNVSSYDIL